MEIIKTIKNSPNKRWYILANIAVGTLMATMDASIITVALPTMAQEFQVNLGVLQWVVTAYLLVITSMLPIFGGLADRLGRKRVYFAGLVIFSIGRVLCGLTWGIWSLVAMRVLQAVGAAMLMSSNQALIVSAFPPQERGRALGLSGTAVALGGLAGPAVGGVLVGWMGWRSIFFVLIPIAVLAILSAQIILPQDKIPKDKIAFDFPGAALFAFGMFSLLYAINSGQKEGWSSPLILVGILLGILAIGLFVVVENRVKDPIIDFQIYTIKPFLIGNVSALLSFMGQFGNTVLLPFYLQQVLHYSTTRVGMIMMVFPLAMMIFAPLSGYLSDKIGPMILTTSGLLLMAAGLFYLVTLTRESTFLYIMPGPLLLGIGSGLFNSPNSSSVMSSVPKNKLGVAGGLNALVRNLGMVLGTTMTVSLFENRQASLLSPIPNPSEAQIVEAFMSAFHTVMIVSGVILLLATAVSVNRRAYLRPSEEARETQ